MASGIKPGCGGAFLEAAIKAFVKEAKAAGKDKPLRDACIADACIVAQAWEKIDNNGGAAEFSKEQIKNLIGDYL